MKAISVPFSLILVAMFTTTQTGAVDPEQLARFIGSIQCPRCDLSEFDFSQFGSDINFNKANLHQANISKANFSATNLSGA